MTQAELKKTFYSNGKLFLIGEYTVIDGSEAFAVPTVYGQHLDVDIYEPNVLKWESYDANGKQWFKASFSYQSIYENRKTGSSVADTLIDILHHAHKANPALLAKDSGYRITTRLTFPRNWGLGSSSTLINNIAQWFAIDAYKLLQQSFGGSGYDIACAQHDTPILYKIENEKPIVKTIDFSPAFLDKLHFVYLNKKQDTRSSVVSYREKAEEIPALIQQVDAIIDEATGTADFDYFCTLLDKHSEIMSRALKLETAKNSLFPDFKGSVKSLGAWGGDFILAASHNDPITYFISKGYETIVPYREMILK